MKAALHRPHGNHEHEFEPQHGLPERLPAHERLLWQGSPDWRMLARRAFHLRKLALYFAAMVLLRAGFVFADSGSALQALRALPGPLALALLALGLVLLLARLSAHTTVYTLTDQRVVMRIGIVLTVTFNLPLRRIASAGLQLDAGGSGDLPLALLPPQRIAWLHLWPHARPWRLARPEPMLRCVPDAARVAQLLSAAWSEANGVAATPRTQAAAPRSAANPARPALAGH